MTVALVCSRPPERFFPIPRSHLVTIRSYADTISLKFTIFDDLFVSPTITIMYDRMLAHNNSNPVQISSMTQTQSSNYMVKVDSFLKGASTNNFYVITVSDFINKAKIDPSWVIVDIRATDLYAQGHVQNALSIPTADLISKMGIIPAGKKVAVYGDSDIDAAFAVETLRVFGDFDAYLLQGGLIALQSAGMPLIA